ncbi:MAG: protein-glutamate O-methyltransferase CheR [Planctomycetales bacterium]|nr:protein-glutamate O-methyltransferase CheR [Planctomycetales bacterium]
MTERPSNSPSSSSYSDATISAPDYEFVRTLLRKEIGFDLGIDRQYLVVNRLIPIAAMFDCRDVGHLIDRVRQSQDRRLIEAVAEGMTINETSFFRGGQKLFDNLAQVAVPVLQRARSSQRRLRIWSGACATGQEPYSILITLLEQCPQLRDWNIEIVATDISERALEQARNGVYNQFEIQRGLPIQMLPKYFTKTGDRWQIADTLRRRVTFHRHNLLDSFLRLAPPLDIVFLRNVLIYFEPSSKTELFQRLRQSMAPDGILVLGETESTLGITTDFQLNNACRDFYQPAI